MAEVNLKKFVPSVGNPWDRVKAAHLLNRAGFGGTPEEIDRFARMRFEAAVDELLNYEAVPGEIPGVTFTEVHEAVEEYARLRAARAAEPTLREAYNRIQRANRGKFQELRTDWVRRMLVTQRPLQEKMVVFWHGHLVSGFPDVKSAEHMSMQLELFRRMATGNFKDLMLAISRDPAMLEYLNNNSNRKGHPNENYARELMELFTTGIGNYTEQDIKEAARAFTGWTYDRNNFVFNERQHDTGMKTFLGTTGNLDGTDIIDIIFERPATARWLPRRLFEFFAYLGPEEAIMDELARVFKASKWSVKAVLRTIFQSALFYSEQTMRMQIKSPVELVVGAVRALGGDASEPVLLRAMDLMGQILLSPPNVGGWPKGNGWINTATIFLRYNFSNLLLNGAMPGVGGRRQTPVRVDHLIDPSNAQTVGHVVDQLVDRFIQAPISDRRRWALMRALGSNREETPFASNGAQVPERLRTAVHLILSMPEYQQV